MTGEKKVPDGAPAGVSGSTQLLADALTELRERLDDLQSKRPTDKVFSERRKCQLLIDRIGLFLSAN